ncbi:hypothetical protein CERSUDRAFT_86827 [Gelatoporia subvermispora B]|uniref:DUF6593 domain-containing protein n=1 Tax=Ceriporiopsis subvermispora (strain B) TaxID=914234 RepID=M2PDZ6_CERS8|nr:hypothetical protein CERSUDRAFT_86827 [Gelatoporia subvermispora B]
MDSPSAVLSLTPFNPTGTTITDAAGRVVYSVTTENGEGGFITHIKDSYGETLATNHWRRTLSDKVSLREQPPISVNDWLQNSMIPFVDDVSFKDSNGKRYKWKGFSTASSAVLLSAEDNYKQSLARFCPPSKDYTTDPPTPLPAQLVLDSRALEIQDTVVLSFLLLEKTRRLREMRKSRAAQSTNIRNQVRFESWDSGFGNYQQNEELDVSFLGTTWQVPWTSMLCLSVKAHWICTIIPLFCPNRRSWPVWPH